MSNVSNALRLVAKVCCDTVSSFQEGNGKSEPNWENATPQQRDLFIDLVKANLESPQVIDTTRSEEQVYVDALIIAVCMSLSPIVINAIAQEDDRK